FAPVGHGARRRADLGLPGPQLERRGDAKPCDPAPLRLGERVNETGLLFADEVENPFRRRKRKGAVGALSDDAAEVDEDEVAAASADLETERKGAIGIERHRDRGLADPAPQRRLTLQEAVRL